MLLVALSGHTEAFSAFRSSNACVLEAKAIGITLSSQLRYADDDKIPLERNYSHRTGNGKGWWPFGVAQSELEPEDEEAAKVDEYLAFLDRRYNMIHEDEVQPPQQQFSALKWLRQGSHDAKSQKQQQEDALHILGLAGLASQRLLHQVEGTKSHPGDSYTSRAVTDVSATSTSSPLRLTTFLALLVEKVEPFFQKVFVQRHTWIQYQSTQVRTALAVLIKGLAVAPPKAARVIWKLGGGRKNIRWTVSVIMALTICIIRPLLQQLLRQAAAVAASP